PNTIIGQNSTSLQAWAILRHIDALAAYTFTGDLTAGTIALGNGAPAQTNNGAWSDGTPVIPLGVTDLPDGDNYFAGSYVVDWDSAANPRGNFPLVNGGPKITGFGVTAGTGSVTATNLLAGHLYVMQSNSDLAAESWSDAFNFTATQTTQSLPVTVT